jgi:hypothetical protein
MKLLKFLLILITFNIYSQFNYENKQLNLNVGLDVKLALKGTDNKYTKHKEVFNYQIKIC